MIPNGTFPKLLQFHDTKDYVRQILGEQIELTADKEVLQNVNNLPDNHRFFWYQQKVNHDVNAVPSHVVIAQHQQQKGMDYRYEDKPSAVTALQNRQQDNVNIARSKQKQLVGV